MSTTKPATVEKPKQPPPEAPIQTLPAVRQEIGIAPETMAITAGPGDTLPAISRDPYAGASMNPFPDRVREIFRKPIDPKIAEITPDGRVYLSAVHFRRFLDDAFGPGGWALIPRSGFVMRDNVMSREYALIVGGRFVSEARGDQDYRPGNPVTSEATATEGVRSDALRRCCKDLLIGSEFWDRQWTRWWKKEYAVKVWCENQKDKERKMLWRRKDDEFDWPWKEIAEQGGAAAPVRPQQPTAASSTAKPAPVIQPAKLAPADPPAKPVPPAKAPPKAAPPETYPPPKREPEGVMRQRFWAILKIAAGVTEDEKARPFLKALSGKEKVSDLDLESLKKLGNALVGVNKGANEIRASETDFTVKIVDKAHGTIVWSAPVPPEPAPAPVEEALPPAAEEAPPPPDESEQLF